MKKKITSIRFKRIAEQFFSTSKKFDKIDLYPYDLRSYDAQKALFQTFSHLTTNLALSRAFYYRYYRLNEGKNPIEYLTTYPCDKLKYLNLNMEHSGNCIALDNSTKEKLKLLFSRLNHLEFENENFLDSQTTEELLSSCSELESISVESTDACKNIHFPKLQKLQLKYSYFEEKEFETMLAFNRSIRKLKFYHTEVGPEILAIITCQT